MARPRTLPNIVGIDLLADETSMIIGTTDPKMYVRKAENVDIDTDGNVSRRNGYTNLISGSGWHSLYSAKRGWLLLCHREELGVYDPETEVTTLLTTMTEAYRTSYAEENGNLYVMNPGFSCMFRPGETTARSIGVLLPPVTPQFTGSYSQGSLVAGRYGVTYSVVNENGEESALGPVVEIELTSQGSIVGVGFTLISGWEYRIYMTSENGEELYETAEFNADVASFTIMDHLLGRQPATFGLEPVAKGHIIRTFNSRLLVGTTNFVYFTEAFRPHLHDPAHGFVPTTGFTTMVEPVSNGVFIADRRGVKFYSGEDPTKWEERSVSTDPVVFGTSAVIPGNFFTGDLAQFNEVAIWLSTAGYQVGVPGGGVVKVNAEQVGLPQYVQGCCAYVVRDGRKQVITPVNSNLLASASVALDSSIS